MKYCVPWGFAKYQTTVAEEKRKSRKRTLTISEHEIRKSQLRRSEPDGIFAHLESFGYDEGKDYAIRQHSGCSGSLEPLRVRQR